MGLDLTSAPLGMWKRGLVVDGWKSFSGMMWVGWKRGGVLLVVLDGSGRQHAGGLGQMPRVGGKPQHWGSHGPLPALQLLFILNSWHIMGIQALGVRQAGHGDPRSSQLACLATARKPVFTSLGDGRMSRFCKTTSKMKNVPEVEQGHILSKQSVGWFSQSERFSPPSD